MSSTRALLLTDVVDSTRLSETLGDQAMAEVWAAHDRVARDLLPPWRGREIDKTDGMLLLFDDAADALQYALAYHRALADMALALKARAGLHVGPVILRENKAEDVARGAKPLEVDGLAKPTTARVMSIARGGQTLLTPEARAALGPAPPVPLQSHGHWVLKGVSTPIELFEGGDDPARFAPPVDGEKVYRVVRVGERWLPAREIPNNLPQQTTSFVGRERELEELRARLGSARLVTLLGMGGMGKTRLSLQVAAEVMAEFPDGAWFIDLSPIREPALVLGEAVTVLGVREEPGRPLLHSLCAHLAPRRMLLVLDNCEHLMQPAADLAHAVLKAAPGVRLMASSREALRVPGEQVVPILPLPLPAQGDGVDALMRSASVRLFVERAQSHKPAFALTAQEAPVVAELVARLDGIPLALELAAARVRSLPVAEINKRLADRFKLLTGGSRVLQERQQTLRALVDWSYDLLQPAEQLLFARLAVFAGGFELEAAETVCGHAPIEPFEVLDLLTSLVEKSLVLLDERSATPRYNVMLQTLRDYAHEKLVQFGDEAATAGRHCAHYFGIAKQVRDDLRLMRAEQAQVLAQAERELDNFRAAALAARGGHADVAIAVKLPMALQTFWLLRGRVGEAREAVRAALALPGVQAVARTHAWGLYIGAVLASSQNDHTEARRLLQANLDIVRGLGNPAEVAAALSTLAVAQAQGGAPQDATASEREALQILEELDDPACLCISHLHLGQFAASTGDAAAATASLQQALIRSRQIGQQEIEAECCFELGVLALQAGDAAGAEPWLVGALRISQASGNRRGEAYAQWGLGRCALLHADADLAAVRERLLAALDAFEEFELREPLLGCLDSLAACTWRQGGGALALTLAQTVAPLRSLWQVPRPAAAERQWQDWWASVSRAADPAQLQAANQRAHQLTLDELLAAARSAPA
jgi:predicted ATPase/class 3 adenylate cyclase